jgi:excisionase family DNA binding protein
MTSDWLTAKAAAESLKVSHRSVVKWARSGRIPAHRLCGGRHTWRFLRSELDAMLAASSVVPAEREAA